MSRTNNEHSTIAKPSEDISTPALDITSPDVRPCTLRKTNEDDIPEMLEEEATLAPKTSILTKIMMAIDKQNRSLHETEALINGVLQLTQAIEFLKKQVRGLEHRLERAGGEKHDSQAKRRRRKAAELERKFTCPHRNCLKTYASDISLNLHARLKHSDQIEKENSRKASLYPTESAESKFDLPPEILKGVQSEYSRMLEGKQVQIRHEE